jgi:hypothetical protein
MRNGEHHRREGTLQRMWALHFHLSKEVYQALRGLQWEGLPLHRLQWLRGMHGLHDVRPDLPRYGY